MCACFTGRYPIELPPAERLGASLVEQPTLGDDGLATLLGGVGGATALEQP